MAVDTTLAGAWASFERECIPTDASPAFRHEIRNSFYSGARAIYTLLMTEADDGPVTDAEVALCQGLEDELTAFAAELVARVAAHRVAARKGSN